jgi:peptide chain release factor 2
LSKKKILLAWSCLYQRYGAIFDKIDCIKKIEEIEVLINASEFWSDNKKAQSIIKEKNYLEKILNDYNFFKEELINIKDLVELNAKDNDENLSRDLTINLENLEIKIKEMELLCFLSKKNDGLDVYVEIHAGAGGTESQDWAEMLRNMYIKWAEKKSYNYSLISETKGEEAGLKSSTIKIEGKYAYGFLRYESGVHRLVRISPFDSGKRRHTSFSSVWVYPVVDENIDVIINEKDLRVDTYRSSGAGGQHVNTTDSAVRITHQPSNIVVQCQNERSQHKNKETAMNMLKARLYELEIQKKEEESKSIESNKKEIGWGHQIRSYILQPYQMVKDNRTGLERSDPEKVLDGNLNPFLEESLHKLN